MLDFERTAYYIENECLEALKTMESDKTPGMDGLPVEFYKVFCNIISNTLINTLWLYLWPRQLLIA